MSPLRQRQGQANIAKVRDEKANSAVIARVRIIAAAAFMIAIPIVIRRSHGIQCAARTLSVRVPFLAQFLSMKEFLRFRQPPIIGQLHTVTSYIEQPATTIRDAIAQGRVASIDLETLRYPSGQQLNVFVYCHDGTAMGLTNTASMSVEELVDTAHRYNTKVSHTKRIVIQRSTLP